MSKIITSPVKRFPGSIVLAQPLLYPQVVELERAITNVQRNGAGMTPAEADAAILPGILACIEEINIPGVSREAWPATPRRAATELMAWALRECLALYDDEATVPNG